MYTYIHLYTSMHNYIHIYTYLRTSTHTYVQLFSTMYIYTHLYTLMHTIMYSPKHTLLIFAIFSVQVALDFITSIGYHRKMYCLCTTYPRTAVSSHPSYTLLQLGITNNTALMVEEIVDGDMSVKC